MIQDAIEEIARLARAGDAIKAPVIVCPPQEQGRRYLLTTADGGYEWRDIKAAPRNHTALSLKTILDFADSANEEIWVSRSKVVALLLGRLESVTFTLALSPQMQLLSQAHRSPLSQKELVKVLRTTLAATGGDEQLLKAVRLLKWTNQQRAEGEIQQKKQSLGKSILAEVEGDIPESAVFRVPVFDNGSLRSVVASIPVALDVDAESQRFTLIPMANAIEDALTSGEKQIIELLDETDAKVYHGNP